MTATTETEIKKPRGLLTLDETAHLLALDRTTKHPRKAVLGLCKKGLLVRVCIGKSVTIDPDSVDKLVGKPIT